MKNQKSKQKPSKILIISLILLSVIAFGISLTKNKTPHYKLSTDEMLVKVKDYQKNTIGPEKYIDIVLNNDTLYRFIDLRTPREFAIGHIENAINIPLQNIFDEKYRSILNQDEKINILYYSDHLGACSPWMLLTQIGFKNNKILLGGYDFVKQSIIDEFSPMTGNFKDEKPKYNFKEEFAKLKSNSGESSEDEENTEINIPIIKKEKKEEVGGC